METSVGLVHCNSIPIIWSDVSEIVEEFGKDWLEVVDLKEIYQGCLEDKFDLWIATRGTRFDGLMVCGWERHAKRSYYHIMWLGGRNLKLYLKQGLEKIEHYACLCGANEVRFGGREGWEKLLKPYGYGSRSVELRKDVTICWRH